MHIGLIGGFKTIDCAAIHVAALADRPIIFVLANPDPEITPEAIAAVRDDAIVATGRSDYPNQVNNVLGFPYFFRGALDVRAGIRPADEPVCWGSVNAAINACEDY